MLSFNIAGYAVTDLSKLATYNLCSHAGFMRAVAAIIKYEPACTERTVKHIQSMLYLVEDEFVPFDNISLYDFTAYCWENRREIITNAERKIIPMFRHLSDLLDESTEKELMRTKPMAETEWACLPNYMQDLFISLAVDADFPASETHLVRARQIANFVQSHMPCRPA